MSGVGILSFVSTGSRCVCSCCAGWVIGVSVHLGWQFFCSSSRGGVPWLDSGAVFSVLA